MTHTLTDFDKGWVAGIIEGEGCWSLYKMSKAGRDYTYPTFELGMTDRDVVETFKRLTGMHQNIHTGKCASGKDIYRLCVRGKQAVLMMLDQFPFMHSRRQSKIQEIILNGYITILLRSKKRDHSPSSVLHRDSLHNEKGSEG
jgi:hypothetical protein